MTGKTRGVFGGAFVVGDVRLRPLEYARQAVTTFLDREIPNAFFSGNQFTRPTTAERTYTSLMGACARAAGYFDVDYCGHVYDMLGGPPGWQKDPNLPSAADGLEANRSGLSWRSEWRTNTSALSEHYQPMSCIVPNIGPGGRRTWRPRARNKMRCAEGAVASREGAPGARAGSLVKSVGCGRRAVSRCRIYEGRGRRDGAVRARRPCVYAIEQTPSPRRHHTRRCKTAIGNKQLRPIFERVRKGAV